MILFEDTYPIILYTIIFLHVKITFFIHLINNLISLYIVEFVHNPKHGRVVVATVSIISAAF